MIIELTADLSPATSRCKAGTFTYNDASGSLVTADFYVICPPREDGNVIITDRRIDALNDQFTDVWTKLEEQSCTNIKYQDVRPSPFF